MKKLILIFFVFVSCVAFGQQNIDTYKVRGRFQLQSDGDFIIGANGDTLNASTQISDTDRTIVTLEYMQSLKATLTEGIAGLNTSKYITPETNASVDALLNVPYEGAMSDVKLGTNSLSAQTLITDTVFVGTDTIINNILVDYDSTGFRLTQSQVIGLVDSLAIHLDTLQAHNDRINANLDSINTHRILIDANSGKDTTGIYHANRTALNLVQNTNTGDQDLSQYQQDSDTTAFDATKYDLETGLATKEPANANIQTHIANVTTNPHSVTATNVGLGNVENAAASGLYEPLFSKNTGFNKNFGTTTGTVLEGRTFGTAANSAIGDFEIPLTFSTGLLRTGNTITNTITQSTETQAGTSRIATLIESLTGIDGLITITPKTLIGVIEMLVPRDSTNAHVSGLINGTNTTFYTFEDYIPNTVQVIVCGVTQDKDVHYSESGLNAIIFNAGFIPGTGEIIKLKYKY